MVGVSEKTLLDSIEKVNSFKEDYLGMTNEYLNKDLPVAIRTASNKIYTRGRTEQKKLQDNIFRYQNQKKKYDSVEEEIKKPLGFFFSYKERSKINEIPFQEKVDRIMNPISIPPEMTSDESQETVAGDMDTNEDNKLSKDEILEKLKIDLGEEEFIKYEQIITKEIGDLYQAKTFDENDILNPNFQKTFYGSFKQTIDRKIAQQKSTQTETKAEDKDNQQDVNTEKAEDIAEEQKIEQDKFDKEQEEQKAEEKVFTDPEVELKDADENANEIPTQGDNQARLTLEDLASSFYSGGNNPSGGSESTSSPPGEQPATAPQQPNPPVETPERPDPALQFVGEREPIIEGERKQFLDVEGEKRVDVSNQVSNLLKQQNEQRQNKSIDVLKQEIRAYHLLYDDNIEEFRTNPHIGQKNDALTSSNIEVVRAHHKSMEDTIAKFYNRGNLRIGIVIDAEEYLRRISTTKLDFVKDGMMETTNTRGGRDIFSRAKSIKSQFIRGGLEHARSKPVLNRLPQTSQPKYKESFLQNPPTMGDTPFKYTIQSRRPMLPDYIKF